MWLGGTTVTNCTNYANVKGTTKGGGICAWVKDITIQNCKNYGDIFIESVNSTYGGAAGTLGYSGGYGKIESCYNEGEIFGNDICGGIIGTRRAHRYK